ncbi:MAG: HAMP domain-containing histidine kinase [Gammaproteobacteria bacterium]|nr:HAMP domain-containing histidine kinase [Gammaproteobacteria bacterium]MCW5583384.1 HAMP domain-containing histidine kinase [Gammaproteobacteria bacterium]
MKESDQLMTTLKQASLGDQVSKKISTWVLIFVAAIILLIFFVSLIQSLQMYNKQVSSWVAVAPRQAITNLIDSDDFSLNREVQLIESTGLFSSFGITDNQKRVIASFGDKQNVNYIPIYDEVSVVWGYYFYKSNFFKFISPFFYSGAIFLVLVTVLYCLIRGRMRTNLDAEFTRFNQFLNEIEKVTNQIHQVYIDELKLDMNPKNSFTNEQLIINRAVSKLLDAIKLANQSLREAILSSEQKKFEDELTRTALQVAHDIGSPLATLEAIVQSASLMLPEESRVAIRNAASKIRDITNSLLKKAKRDLMAMDNGELAQQMLASLVSQIITEKRIQYQDNNAIKIHLKITHLSILVTSRLYLNEIAMRCEASGIKFLPKDMASIVPIEWNIEIK